MISTRSFEGIDVSCGEEERVDFLLAHESMHDRFGVIDVFDAEGVAEFVGYHECQIYAVVKLIDRDGLAVVFAFVKACVQTIERIVRRGAVIVGRDEFLALFAYRLQSGEEVTELSPLVFELVLTLPELGAFVREIVVDIRRSPAACIPAFDRPIVGCQACLVGYNSVFIRV